MLRSKTTLRSPYYNLNLDIDINFLLFDAKDMPKIKTKHDRKKITKAKKVTIINILTGICILMIIGTVLVIQNMNRTKISTSLNNSQLIAAPTLISPSPVQQASNVKTTVVHLANPSSDLLLSYTYIPTNNYFSASAFKGFTISYPASWNLIIIREDTGGAQGSRDEIDLTNNENKLIFAQPVEGANCYYPPEPTGGYGGYYTNFSNVRTINGKVWRRSKIDNGQFGIDANYIICQGTGDTFTDDNLLGGIYYKVPSDSSTVISEMDTMIKSVILDK